VQTKGVNFSGHPRLAILSIELFTFRRKKILDIRGWRFMHSSSKQSGRMIRWPLLLRSPPSSSLVLQRQILGFCYGSLSSDSSLINLKGPMELGRTVYG
jgi:hypothetical protein